MREFDRATIAVMAQGTAAYAVSSNRLPHFQGLPLALTGHVASTVVPVGFPRVVRLAPQAQVDSGVRAALAPRMAVSKLKATGLVAAVAVFADKTAAPVVARPHLSPHGELEVTSPPCGDGCGCRRPGLGLLCSGLAGDAGFALVHLGQKHAERSLDDRSRVPAGDPVGEQILELLERLSPALREGDLKLVAAWRKRG